MSGRSSLWAWNLKIPPTEKIVLMRMADYVAEDNEFSGNHDDLAHLSCLDIDELKCAIMDLHDRGLVKLGKSGITLNVGAGEPIGEVPVGLGRRP